MRLAAALAALLLAFPSCARRTAPPPPEGVYATVALRVGGLG